MAQKNTVSLKDKALSKEELDALNEIESRGPANKFRDRKRFCERFGRDIQELIAYLNRPKSSTPAPAEQSTSPKPKAKEEVKAKGEIRIAFKSLRVEGNIMIFEV